MAGFKDKMKGIYYYEDERVPDAPVSGRAINPLLNGSNGSNGADGSNDGSNGAEPKKVKSLEELTGIMAPPYKEETAEEKAAREKRDAARIGWAGMLDGLNALSNLYYTTKGAPSQKLGNGALAPVMADINEKEKLRRVQADKNREAVMERAKMIANAELERNLAEMKYQAAREQEDQEYENRKKLYELTHGHTMKEIEARGLNNVGLEGLRQEGRVNLEGIRQGGREALADKRAAAALERETVRQDAISSRSGSGGASKRTIMLDDGKEYEYDKSKEGALLSVFGDLKKELQKAKDPLGFAMDDAKSAAQKIAILQELVKNYPEYSERVRGIVGKKGNSGSLLPADEKKENKKSGSLLP